LNLSLSKNIIELKPSENRTIKATVENLATIKDEIELELNYVILSGFEVKIIEPKQVELEPNESHEFSIIISIDKEINMKELLVTITAKSINGPNYSQSVEKSEILTVKVLEETKPDDKKEDKESDIFNLILPIVIIIVILFIIILIILIFIKKKKKEPEEPKVKPVEPMIQQQLTPPTLQPEPPQEQISTQPQPEEISLEPQQELPQTEGPMEAPPEGIQKQTHEEITLEQPFAEKSQELTQEDITSEQPETQVQERPIQQQEPVEMPQEQLVPVVSPERPLPTQEIGEQEPESQPEALQQPLTTLCPLCNQQIPEYSNPCPNCGGALEWGDSS
jgi:hypothetical protein